MEGYVENVGMAPMYALKRVINKGDKVEFDELLKRFGNEAGVNCDSSKAFANWLANNKFIDRSKWKVVAKKKVSKPKVKQPKIEQKIEQSKEKVEHKVEQVKSEKIVEEKKPISKVTATNKEIIRRSVTGVSRKITVDDIIGLKIGELKTLEKFNDEKLLRTALKKAEGMARKAVLCNAIRDRLSRLSIR